MVDCIGDDETCWGDAGAAPCGEGGCYDSCGSWLSKEAEPEIYETTQRFGTIIENVVMKEGGSRDAGSGIDDPRITENTSRRNI